MKAYFEIWGFKDAEGLTNPEVILGAGDDENKKFAMLDAARDQHVFPSGYKRIALAECVFGS